VLLVAIIEVVIVWWVMQIDDRFSTYTSGTGVLTVEMERVQKRMHELDMTLEQIKLGLKNAAAATAAAG